MRSVDNERARRGVAWNRVAAISCRQQQRSSLAFNNPRRSQMIVQVAAIQAYGLVEAHELGRFTAPTRATIESLAKAFTR
jgi:hypothetical protein